MLVDASQPVATPFEGYAKKVELILASLKVLEYALSLRAFSTHKKYILNLFTTSRSTQTIFCSLTRYKTSAAKGNRHVYC